MAKRKKKTSIGIHFFANPARFLRFARRIFPWVTAIAILCIVVGLVLGLAVVPAD